MRERGKVDLGEERRKWEWGVGREPEASGPYPLADDDEWVRRGYAPVPTAVGTGA